MDGRWLTDEYGVGSDGSEGVDDAVEMGDFAGVVVGDGGGVEAVPAGDVALGVENGGDGVVSEDGGGCVFGDSDGVDSEDYLDYGVGAGCLDGCGFLCCAG